MIFTNQLFIFFSLQILRNCAHDPLHHLLNPIPRFYALTSILTRCRVSLPSTCCTKLCLTWLLCYFFSLLLDFVTTEGALAVVAVQSVSIIYALLCKANALVCIQMFCFTLLWFDLLCFTLLCLFFFHSRNFQLLWVRNPQA